MRIIETPFSCDTFTFTATEYYRLAAKDPLPDSVALIPKEFTPALEALYAGVDRPVPKYDPPMMDWLGARPMKEVDPDLCVIGATGGKDSLAVALQLRSEGIKCVFLHVRGMNPAYPHEERATKMQADALRIPYYKITVNVGKKSYTENPARNHVLLLLQAHVARNIGAGMLAQGLHSNRVAESQPFRTGWSDCDLMARAGKAMIEGCAPWLMNRVDGLPESDTESIDCVVQHAPDMLPMVQSCMQTLQWHANVRASSIKKAGYELLPGRCGSCYKCIREWMVLREHGYYKPAPTYERHIRRLLFTKHVWFVYGPAASGWSNEKILRTFLARPRGTQPMKADDTSDAALATQAVEPPAPRKLRGQ